MPFGILITKGLFSASASINTRRYRIFPYLKATTTALSGTVKSALMSSADKLLFNVLIFLKLIAVFLYIIINILIRL